MVMGVDVLLHEMEPRVWRRRLLVYLGKNSRASGVLSGALRLGLVPCTLWLLVFGAERHKLVKLVVKWKENKRLR